jgi:hypothetical protein
MYPKSRSRRSDREDALTALPGNFGKMADCVKSFQQRITPDVGIEFSNAKIVVEILLLISPNLQYG